MKCKNCNHKLEEAVDEWKKIAKKYTKSWSGFWHTRQSYAIGSLGFTGRKQFMYMKKCFCSCIKPELELT